MYTGCGMLPPLLAKLGNTLLIEGELTGREQAYMLHLGNGALTVHIKQADTVDLIIKKVDTVGMRAAHRVEIQQCTTDGELAMFHHLAHTVVATVL